MSPHLLSLSTFWLMLCLLLSVLLLLSSGVYGQGTVTFVIHIAY